ncbi:MAG: FtsX-like permease family protein [Pyrinomonadaceae bacterium]
MPDWTGSIGATGSTCCGAAPAPFGTRCGYSRSVWRTRCFRTCASACVGLYGILSYSVASRTNEIGIWMALGARSRNVFWMILREALWLVVAGVPWGCRWSSP